MLVEQGIVVIENVFVTGAVNADVAYIGAGFGESAELLFDGIVVLSFFGRIVGIGKQVTGDIAVVRQHQGNVFHILNVGVDVGVYLLNKLVGVFSGILHNGFLGVIQGNQQVD